MHEQLQPEDLIDFTVKLKSYSLYNSSCQQSESDINMINGNAQFTRLQVCMDALSKHARKPSPALRAYSHAKELY